MNEPARRIDADAHAAAVERFGVAIQRIDRDAGDFDVHRAGVIVPARIAVDEAEARDEHHALAAEVIVDPRELLVELAAYRAHFAGLRAAKHLVEFRECGFIEAAIGLVDVELHRFGEVLGAQPHVAGWFRERFGAQA